MKFLFQPLPRLLGICLLPLPFLPLVHYLAVASHGSWMFLLLQIAILPVFLAAVAGLLISPFRLFSAQHRPAAIRALIASVVVMAALICGVRLALHIRMSAFLGLAGRSAPLVQAIRAYETRHHTPPPDLAALVPDFLPAIPGTGIAAYSEYRYHTGPDAARYEGNPWVLCINTPSGFLNWDMFFYFPLQNYPKTGHGGSFQPIQDWAYLRE